MFCSLKLPLYLCFIINTKTKIMKALLLLPDLNGKFRLVECFLNKYGYYSHNDGDYANGFECKEDAIKYCNEFNFKLIIQ